MKAQAFFGAQASLRRKFLAWLLLPLAVMWSVSAWVDYEVAETTVGHAFDRALLSTALDLANQVRPADGKITVELPPVAREIIEADITDRIYYRVVDRQGQTVFGQTDLPLPDDDVAPGQPYFYDTAFEGAPIRVVAIAIAAEQPVPALATVIAGERVEKRRGATTQIIVGMAIPQAVLVILVLAAVWITVKRILAPLGRLAGEIGSRSPRDLAPLSENIAPAEVRPLIRSMNDMLARLGSALDAQQRFIADAAHQLRTPLAGIRTQTELALRQNDIGEVRATLSQLMNATERTTHLINQMLSLARAEPGAQRASAPEPLDLTQLARETAMEWVPRALTHNIDLGFDAEQRTLSVPGDAFMLKEMLSNLLDNAIRYTQAGGNVTVRVAAEDNRVALCVEDNGPGIPESERERVFERFHRVLGSSVEGVGLGLAIVREIAESHGAQVALGAGLNGVGTSVRVVFPAAPVAKSRLARSGRPS